MCKPNGYCSSLIISYIKNITLFKCTISFFFSSCLNAQEANKFEIIISNSVFNYE